MKLPQGTFTNISSIWDLKRLIKELDESFGRRSVDVIRWYVNSILEKGKDFKKGHFVHLQKLNDYFTVLESLRSRKHMWWQWPENFVFLINFYHITLDTYLSSIDDRWSIELLLITVDPSCLEYLLRLCPTLQDFNALTQVENVTRFLWVSRWENLKLILDFYRVTTVVQFEQFCKKPIQNLINRSIDTKNLEYLLAFCKNQENLERIVEDKNLWFLLRFVRPDTLLVLFEFLKTLEAFEILLREENLVENLKYINTYSLASILRFSTDIGHVVRILKNGGVKLAKNLDTLNLTIVL
jgi:hypothetical protein